MSSLSNPIVSSVHLCKNMVNLTCNPLLSRVKPLHAFVYNIRNISSLPKITIIITDREYAPFDIFSPISDNNDPDIMEDSYTAHDVQITTYYSNDGLASYCIETKTTHLWTKSFRDIIKIVLKCDIIYVAFFIDSMKESNPDPFNRPSNIFARIRQFNPNAIFHILSGNNNGFELHQYFRDFKEKSTLITVSDYGPPSVQKDLLFSLVKENYNYSDILHDYISNYWSLESGPVIFISVQLLDSYKIKTLSLFDFIKNSFEKNHILSLCSNDYLLNHNRLLYDYRMYYESDCATDRVILDYILYTVEITKKKYIPHPDFKNPKAIANMIPLDVLDRHKVFQLLNDTPTMRGSPYYGGLVLIHKPKWFKELLNYLLQKDNIINKLTLYMSWSYKS